VVAAAREANALIDQRTFSWTEFFNVIEATLPADVMLSSVRPEVKDGQTQVTMMVLARRAEDIDAFMESLEATKAFAGLLPASERLTDDGLHETQLVGRYAATPGEGVR
jgi:Tfp pilus assembly protein PilN